MAPTGEDSSGSHQVLDEPYPEPKAEPKRKPRRDAGTKLPRRRAKLIPTKDNPFAGLSAPHRRLAQLALKAKSWREVGRLQTDYHPEHARRVVSQSVPIQASIEALREREADNALGIYKTSLKRLGKRIQDANVSDQTLLGTVKVVGERVDQGSAVDATADEGVLLQARWLILAAFEHGRRIGSRFPPDGIDAAVERMAVAHDLPVGWRATVKNIKLRRLLEQV